MPYDESYADELARVKEYHSNQARVNSYAAAATPDLAQRTASIGSSYPQVGGKTAYALAASGHDASSPLVQEVAVRSQNKKGGGFWSGGPGAVIGRATRTAIRAGMATVESPFQAVSGAWRDVASFGGAAGRVAAGALAGAGTGAAIGAMGWNPFTVVGGALVGAGIGGASAAMAPDVKGHWVNPLTQTTLGQIASQAASGGGVDIGSGYFVGGKAREEQIKKAREAANFNGSALTGGRLLASGIFHPGSQPYSFVSGVIDATLITKYDPAILAGAEVKAFREARGTILGSAEGLEGVGRRVTQARAASVTTQELDEAGQMGKRLSLVQANAPAVDAPFAAEAFLREKDVLTWAERMAGETDAKKIWDMSGRKFSIKAANDIAEASSAQDVLDVARKSILEEGLNERKAFEQGGKLASTFSPIRNSRFMAVMPSGGIDLVGVGDKNGWKLGRAVEKYDNFLKNTGIEESVRNEQVNKLMKVGSVAEAQEVLNEGIAGHVADHFAKLGWDLDKIDASIGKFSEARKELQAKAWGELSEDGEVVGTVIDGKAEALPRASAVSEYAEHIIDLPDVAEMRRLSTPSDKLRAVYNSEAWKGSVKAMDGVMSRAWRPLVLLRPAWAVRMVGEESARLIANGMDAPGLNPMSMISMLISPESRYTNALGAAGDVLGTSEAHQTAMTRITSLKGDAGQFSKHKQTYAVGHPRYGQAIAGNLVELHVDDLSRQIIDNGLDETRRWWWEGEGKSLREEYSIKNGRPMTQEESDLQVFMQHDRIKTVTGNNPRLIHAVSTGYLPKEGYALDAVPNSFVDVEQRVHDMATEAADSAAERALRQSMSKKARKVAEEMEGKAVASPSKVKKSAAENAVDRAAKKAARAKADELLPGQEAKQAATKAARVRAGLTAEQSSAVDAIADVLKQHGFDGETVALAPSAVRKSAEIAGVEYSVDMNKHILKALTKGGPKALTAEQQDLLKIIRQNAYDAAVEDGRKAIYKELGTTPQAATEGLPKFMETGEKARINLRRTDGQGLIDDDAAELLNNMGMQPDAGLPREVKGAREVTGDYQGMMGKTKQWMFNHFMSIPTNELTRSPTFNQAYWNKMAEMMPLMDEAGRAQTMKMLAQGTTEEASKISERIDELDAYLRSETDDALKKTAAEEMHNLQVQMADKGVVKINGRMKARFEREAATGKSGVMTLEQADELAKAEGLDTVEQLLDNNNEHRAFDHALRHIAPFGHAWRQAAFKWTKVLAEDPTAIRKFQRVVTAGGMSSALDSSMSLDFVKQEAKSRGVEFDDNATKEDIIKQVEIEGHNGGFFYKNDNGEWSFNYPGGELFTRIATGEGLNPIHRYQTGVPTPLSAKAGGLSMMTTQIMPGAGPMVSILASKILPNKPEWDAARNLLAPFGDPTSQGVVEGFLPPWMKRLKQAFADPSMDRMQGNTTMEIARYLVSTGEYNTNTPEAQEELLDAAGTRAKHLTMLRAAAQLFVPSSPTPIAVANVKSKADPEGRTMVAQHLVQDLQKMQRADYDTATQNFLDKYGDQALLFLQSSTRPVKGNLPDTDKGYDFARSNPDLVRDFPNTFGFFAPPDGKFEYSAYVRSLQTGDREQLTPKQQVELANDRVGSMIYYTLKDRYAGKLTAEQRGILGQIKIKLADQFPGFNRAGEGLTNRATNERMIGEITEAMKNEKVAASPVGKAVNDYLTLRQVAMQAAEKRGVKGFATSAKTADIREVMRKAGDMLSAQTPGFNLVYDRVFDQEMKNDLLLENT